MIFTPELIEERSIPEPNSGCWIWLGYTFTGYGRLRSKGKSLLAHRVSYTVYGGEIPDGFCVRHKCDNPSCVNPDHLLIGTLLDNNKDRDDRGRTHRFNGARRGENNPRARLTWLKVGEIRELAGLSSKADLARKFGVSEKTIGDIVSNRRCRS